jgi:hypothetical protein
MPLNIVDCRLMIVLLKAQAAKFRLTTPKAFTLTLGTLAHFRHSFLLMTKDAAERRSWTFCEAVKIDFLRSLHYVCRQNTLK